MMVRTKFEQQKRLRFLNVRVCAKESIFFYIYLYIMQRVQKKKQTKKKWDRANECSKSSSRRRGTHRTKSVGVNCKFCSYFPPFDHWFWAPARATALCSSTECFCTNFQVFLSSFFFCFFIRNKIEHNEEPTAKNGHRTQPKKIKMHVLKRMQQ